MVKNCDGRHESKPKPLQLVSFERPSLDLCSLEKRRFLTGILQGSIDEMSLQPDYAWWQLMGGKISPQIGTFSPPSKLLHCMPKGYLWGTRTGSVFENITGTCIQHLKVFDPFMKCWQLFAIEVYVRVTSQAKGGSRASLLDQRTPGSCLDHKMWDSQREGMAENSKKSLGSCISSFNETCSGHSNVSLWLWCPFHFQNHLHSFRDPCKQ